LDIQTLKLFIGFFIVAIAANQIAKALQKFKLPLITGLIITGLIAGISFLNFIPTGFSGNDSTNIGLEKLNFLNQIALAIIAFHAGSELYIDDLRSRLSSIKWMSISQMIFGFLISTMAVFLLSNYITFFNEMSFATKLSVSALFGTIFVASSPSSAIAVIGEMRANGPFTKTSIGVTVVKDVLVIILFAISFAIAKTLVHGEKMDVLFLVFLVIEIILSIGLGILIGKILNFPLSWKIHHLFKSGIIIIIGYTTYLFAEYVKHKTHVIFDPHGIQLEPLLILIIASFVITNYSKNRIEFAEILDNISPIIYIIFFTLTGASLSLPIFFKVVQIALALFFVRLIAFYISGFVGTILANDDKKYRHISWMPYVTQAGVGLGLATIVAIEFSHSWGHEFETIIIAIIVINQLIGPPIFKFALNFVGETHLRAKMSLEKSSRDAVIFGVESQSIALANQLNKHKWKTRLVCMDDFDTNDAKNHEILILDTTEPSINDLQKLELEKVEAVILMLSDNKNYHLAELIYEHCGTKEIIVRLNNRDNFEKFHNLGCLIIEPATAMVSLLDHFVRSPNATSLLLGMDEGQDSMDVEIKNQDFSGLRIRELRLPTDIIILSIKRNDQLIVTHGYTRLRLGDILTLVGNEKSLEDIKFKLDK
jgi:Trk K+ transport system NAD-binding subunit/Kef-type K+ transport system membrane component KefB